MKRQKNSVSTVRHIIIQNLYKVNAKAVAEKNGGIYFAQLLGTFFRECLESHSFFATKYLTIGQVYTIIHKLRKNTSAENSAQGISCVYLLLLRKDVRNSLKKVWL